MGNAALKSRAKPRGARSSRGLSVLVVAALVALAAGWYLQVPAQSYAGTGAAYAARVGCSCRFVAGRDIADCARDKLAGMELVTLVENVEDKSVTARFPLIASETARYREGYGCVLQPWEG